MNLLKTGLLLIGFIASAFPLTVDFAPIQVGNVWVFEQSYSSNNFHYIPEYRIDKTIRITKVNVKGDTTYFTAFVKDSGSLLPDTPRVNAVYYVDGFKTKDTLFTKKSNDSTVSEHGIENFDLGQFFPYPTLDTATLVIGGYLTEKYGLWEGKVVGTCVYNRIGGLSFVISDTCIILQNLGLLYRSYLSIFFSGGSGVGGTTTTRLISFNGTSVPVVNAPVNSLRKVNFANCGQLFLHNGRLGVPHDGQAYFDICGRLLPMSNEAHRGITSGIFFSKKVGNSLQH